MKIAFYSSSLSKGGLELNSIRYAQYMRDAGFDVLFFCIENSPLEQACKESKIAYQFIKRNKRYWDWKCAKKIAHFHQSLNIDWWWFRDPRDLDTMAWAKWWSGGKMKLLYHQGMQMAHPKKDPIHSWRFKKINQWICLSEELAHQVKTFTHFPEKRIQVIPLALVDGPQSKPYKGGTFKTLVIGRWDPQKNQHIVVNAFHMLHHRYPQLELTFIGESTAGESEAYEKDIKKKVRHWDLQNVIHFKKFQYQLTDFYADAHLFIIPSLKETFGMVTIEAMRAGLPILGANTGGTRMLIEENQCGDTFAPENAQELSELWENAIQNADWRQQKSIAARSAYENQFSIEHQIHQWRSVLHS